MHIKIYTITTRTGSTRLSFRPYTYDPSVYLAGTDDGGVDYDVPNGYVVSQDDADTPEIRDEDGRYCPVIANGSRPALMTPSGKVIYLTKTKGKNETVKIYMVHKTDISVFGTTTTREYSLTPYVGGESSYHNGRDDGGKNYILPRGCTVTGNCISKDSTQCLLINKTGPAIAANGNITKLMPATTQRQTIPNVR